MKLTKGYKTVTNINQIKEVYYYLNSSGKLMKRCFDESNIAALQEAIRKQSIFLPENQLQSLF